MKHTEKDFDGVDFAKHSDGRLAHRVRDDEFYPWAFEYGGSQDQASTRGLVDEGFEPVREGIELTESELEKLIDYEHAIAGTVCGSSPLRRFALSLGVTTRADPEPEWPDAPGSIINTTGKISGLEHSLVLCADNKWRSVGAQHCTDPLGHPSETHILREVVATA